MNTSITQEASAAAAFSEQAPVFDRIYAHNTIVHYKRKRVRDHVTQWLQPQSNILELNAGTGDDAIWFATQGHHVHATDVSTGMQVALKSKVSDLRLAYNVSTEICSYTSLAKLQEKGPYDFVFSNFAGLNCTDQLQKVIHSLDELLKPGGFATLVLLPDFCLWESLLLFKGKFKTATRRWFSSKGVTAHVEGHYFKCWYYSPRSVINMLPDNFKVLGVEGLCTFVPPSYIEGFAERYPRIYQWLVSKEEKWKSKWPFKGLGDYYILSILKTS